MAPSALPTASPFRRVFMVISLFCGVCVCSKLHGNVQKLRHNLVINFRLLADSITARMIIHQFPPFYHFDQHIVFFFNFLHYYVITLNFVLRYGFFHSSFSIGNQFLDNTLESLLNNVERLFHHAIFWIFFRNLNVIGFVYFLIWNLAIIHWAIVATSRWEFDVISEK